MLKLGPRPESHPDPDSRAMAKVSKIPKFMTFMRIRKRDKDTTSKTSSDNCSNSKAAKNESNLKTKTLVSVDESVEKRDTLAEDSSVKQAEVKVENSEHVMKDTTLLPKLETQSKTQRSYDDRKFPVKSDSRGDIFSKSFDNQTFRNVNRAESLRRELHQGPVSEKITRKEISLGIVADRAKIFEAKIAKNKEIRESMTFKTSHMSTSTSSSKSTSSTATDEVKGPKGLDVKAGDSHRISCFFFTQILLITCDLLCISPFCFMSFLCLLL